MSGEVLVVGAVNVDLVVATEKLPGPGETAVGPGVERHGGGKGADATVRLVGAVGADDLGAQAVAELCAEGVDDRHVAVLDAVATGVALIVVDAAGENQIAVGAGANGALPTAHVAAALEQALPGAACVLVSTEITGEAVAAAVEAASASGVRCVLNPAPPIDHVVPLLGLGPILTPNATEVLTLAGKLADADPSEDGHGLPADGRAGADPGPAPVTVVDCARALMARTAAPVIVTMGSEGALVLTPDGGLEQVPVPPVPVRDTTGAGDTFNGVLVACLAAGAELLDAVRLAVAAASLSVSAVGARSGMPKAAEIEAAQEVA